MSACTCVGCSDPVRRVDRELAEHVRVVTLAIRKRDTEATGCALDQLIAWALPLLASTELDAVARRELAARVHQLWLSGEAAGTRRA